MEQKKRKRSLPNKLIAFLLSFAMVVSVFAGALPGTKLTTQAAETDVTFYYDDTETEKEGVTLSDFWWEDGDLFMFGTVTTAAGKITKIVVTGEWVEIYGDGWTINDDNDVATWTGSGTSVSAGEGLTSGGFSSMVVTIDDAVEYTVTYKVVNGTWSDDTTADKTETVAGGSNPASVPTGMKAAEGYRGGVWNTNPATAITGNTTFTYTFTPSVYPLSEDMVPGTGSLDTADLPGFVATDLDVAKLCEGLPTSGGAILIYGQSNDLCDFVVFTDGASTGSGSVELTKEAYNAFITDGKKVYYTFVLVPVTGVSLDKEETVVGEGEAVALNATISPEDATFKKVKWESDDESVKLYSDEDCKTEVGTDATDALKVYAKGVKSGSATVTVKNDADPTKSDTCTVTVKPLPDADDFTFSAPSDLTYNGSPKDAGVVADLEGTGKVYVHYFSDAKRTDEVDAPVDAGTYYVSITTEGGDVYAPVTEPIYDENADWSFTIEPRVAEFEWSNTSLPYSGQPQNPTVTIKNKVLVDDVDVVLSDPKTQVGTYTAEVKELSGEAKDNYSVPDNNTHVFSIVKESVNLTVSIEDWTYGDTTLPDYVVRGLPTGSSPADLTIEYKPFGGKNIEYTTTRPTDAGKYNIRATLPAGEGYDAATAEDVFSINPKEVEIKWSEVTTHVYDGEDFVPTAKLSGLVGEDYIEPVISGAAVDAGSYVAKVESLDGEKASNYVLPEATGTVDPTSQEFTITPIEANLSWADEAFVYDGDEHVPSCIVSNLVGDDVCDVTVNVVGQEGGAVDAGKYTAVAAELSNSNYELSEGTTTTFTIGKAKIEPTLIALDWSYSEEAAEPMVLGNTGKGEVTITYFKDEACTTKTGTADGAEAEGGVPSKAGAYYAKAVIAATTNYDEAETNVSAFDILPLELEIEWIGTEFFYNGETHLPVANAVNAVKGDKLTLEVTGEKTDAGTYEAELAISGDDAGNYELLEADSTQSFTIAKRLAELEWDENREFIYNGNDQAPEVIVKNLIEGDKCTVTVIGKATEVGVHTATATKLSNKNYQLPDNGTEECEFTIVKSGKKESSATVTMESWTYGDNAPDPVVEGNVGGGTVNFKYAEADEASIAQYIEDPSNFDYSKYEYNTTVKPSDAGYYIVKAQIGETKNYEAIDVYCPFVISKKVAKLAWDPETLTFEFDGKEHIPTCTVSNLKAGDKVDVTVGGAAAKVGEHTATATELTGDSAKNYKLPEAEVEKQKTFNITSGKFDFVVTMTGWTYGEKANDPQVANLPADFVPTYTYYTDEECKNKTTTDDGAASEGAVPAYAGTYYVEASIAVESYEPYSTVASFVIEQRQLGVEWSDTSFEYDGKEHIPTATATNVVEGDKVTFDVTEAQKNAGEYEAKITFMAGEKNRRNYKLPEVTKQTFKIAKKVAELGWDENKPDTEKLLYVYTGYDQVPTCTVTNLVEGDVCKVTVSGAATVFGLHTAMAVKLSNDNYELPENTQAFFAILKADPADLGDDSVAVSMDDWTYGDTPNEPVVKNNIGGGTVTYSYAKVEADSVADVIKSLIKILAGADFKTSKPKDAGIYVIRAEIAETENYKSATVYNAFEIEPKEAKLEWSGFIFFYTGDIYQPECEVGNLEYGDEVLVTVSGGATDVGLHEAEAVELSGESADNYAIPEDNKTKFIIFKGDPAFIVTMSGWTYGDEAAEPQVEGNWGDGDLKFRYYVDEECTIETSEEDGIIDEYGKPSFAGTYYVKAYVEATEKYDYMESVAEFTIEPRQLGVEWSDGGFIYNGNEQAPEPVATNVAEGDEVVFEITGEAVDAGEYEARIVYMPGEDIQRNYRLPRRVTCPFKISPLEAEIEWGETTFEYDAKDHIPTVTIKNIVDGDSCKAIVTGATTNIGVHTATIVKLTNKNYVVNDEDIEKEFEITKGTQIITAKDLALKFEQSKAINATTSGDGAISYSIKSGKNVIKLDETGNVTATREGTAVVEITAAETKYYKKATKTIKVTVTANTIDIYRVYNPNSGEHVYTKSAAEKDSLVKAGWKYEGVAWKSPVKSNTPVYRLYNANAGDHHYTVNANEKANLIKAGWKDEGIVWYSDDLKTAPVYRVYNPNAKAGAHHFTKSQQEVKDLVKAGWQDEAVAFYSK